MVTVELPIDAKSGVPYYRQIIDQVKCAIAYGNLRPGDRFPPVRRLAADLSVSLYFAKETGPPTVHSLALQTMCRASVPGDFTKATLIPTEGKVFASSKYIVTGVDVLASTSTRVVVALGEPGWPMIVCWTFAAEPITVMQASKIIAKYFMMIFLLSIFSAKCLQSLCRRLHIARVKASVNRPENHI